MNAKNSIFFISMLCIAIFSTQGYCQEKPKQLIDTHFHSYDLKTIKDSVDKYFTNNKGYNIQKIGVITIAGRKDTLKVIENNNILINYAAKDNRIFPICSVHPYDIDFSLRELDRLKAKNVKFIKLHPVTQGFNVADSNVYKVTKKAGKLGMVVLFDGYNLLDADQIGKFFVLALRCPDTKIIIAHTGMFDFTKLNLIVQLKDYPYYKKNIYVDIAEVAPILLNSPYKDQLMWTLRNIGTDHILFGTGSPSFTVKVTVDALQKSGFSDKELQLIYHDNAAGLIGLN